MPVDEQHPYPVKMPLTDYHHRKRSSYSQEPQAVMICGPHKGRLAVIIGRVPRASVPAMAVYLPAIQQLIVTVPSHLEGIRPIRGGNPYKPRKRGEATGEEASA